MYSKPENTHTQLSFYTCEDLHLYNALVGIMSSLDTHTHTHTFMHSVPGMTLESLKVSKCFVGVLIICYRIVIMYSGPVSFPVSIQMSGQFYTILHSIGEKYSVIVFPSVGVIHMIWLHPNIG